MPRPPHSHANAHGRRYSPRAEPTPHEKLDGIRYRIELLRGDTWVHVGAAAGMDAGLRLIGVLGGRCRIVRSKCGAVVHDTGSGT